MKRSGIGRPGAAGGRAPADGGGGDEGGEEFGPGADGLEADATEIVSRNAWAGRQGQRVVSRNT